MRKSLLAVMLLAAWLPAQAVTQTVVTTGDLALGGPTQNFSYELTGSAMSPPFDIELAVGDVFDFTIHFLPGQTLTITNPSTIWAFSFANGTSSDVKGTGQLTLLDAQGQALFVSNMKTDTEGVVHFGQYFSAGDFNALPSTFTIGGLHYVGTLEEYIEPGVISRHYDDPRLTLSADAVVSSVPEPAPSLLLLAGLATGLLLKRRSR